MHVYRHEIEKKKIAQMTNWKRSKDYFSREKKKYIEALNKPIYSSLLFEL